MNVTELAVLNKGKLRGPGSATPPSARDIQEEIYQL